jgi:uncharacterized protein (TIGR02647 family)
MDTFNETLIQELNLLMKFPDSSLEGLKIHHSAEPALVDAAQRLFDKKLVTRHDGGYLTDLGHEAAEAARLLVGLMTPH